jgi:hypothetical protein
MDRVFAQLNDMGGFMDSNLTHTPVEITNTTERGGGESVVFELKQFLSLLKHS